MQPEPSGDLADPGFEPTDEDLDGLCRRAFGAARVERERVLLDLRAAIQAARAEALRAFQAAAP